MDVNNPDAPHVASDSESSEGGSPRSPAGQSLMRRATPPSRQSAIEIGADARDERSPTQERDNPNGNGAAQANAAGAAPASATGAPPSDAISAQLSAIQELMADLIRRSEVQDATIRHLTDVHRDLDRRVRQAPLPETPHAAVPRLARSGPAPIAFGDISPRALTYEEAGATPNAPRRIATPRGSRSVVFSPPLDISTMGSSHSEPSGAALSGLITRSAPLQIGSGPVTPAAGSAPPPRPPSGANPSTTPWMGSSSFAPIRRRRTWTRCVVSYATFPREVLTKAPSSDIWRVKTQKCRESAPKFIRLLAPLLKSIAWWKIPARPLSRAE